MTSIVNSDDNVRGTDKFWGDGLGVGFEFFLLHFSWQDSATYLASFYYTLECSLFFIVPLGKGLNPMAVIGRPHTYL